MKDELAAEIELARANESLRQERIVFEVRKRQSEWWFALRIVMGYSSIGLLAIILLVSGWIVFNAGRFAPSVVAWAGGALFVDTLGLVISVWKGVMKPEPQHTLEPITSIVSNPRQ